MHNRLCPSAESEGIAARPPSLAGFSRAHGSRKSLATAPPRGGDEIGDQQQEEQQAAENEQKQVLFRLAEDSIGPGQGQRRATRTPGQRALPGEADRPEEVADSLPLPAPQPARSWQRSYRTESKRMKRNTL